MSDGISEGEFGIVVELSISKQLSHLSSVFSEDIHLLDIKIRPLHRIVYGMQLSISDPTRPYYVQLLARSRLWLYLLKRQQDASDLDHSILGFTEAIFLSSSIHTQPNDLTIVQMFHSLAFALFSRAQREESEKVEDLKWCTMYLRYLHNKHCEASFDIPLSVTENLVHALMVQVESGLGDVDKPIEESAALCDELLDSYIPRKSPNSPIVPFVRAVRGYVCTPFRGQIPPEKVFGCLRKVTTRLSGQDLHEASIALAESLLIRFSITPSRDDFEEGMAILNKVISLRDPADSPSPHWKIAMKLASQFSMAQFRVYGKPEHLEEAIDRHRTFLNEAPPEDPGRIEITQDLSDLQKLRLRDLKVPNVQNALSGILGSTMVPSFRDLLTSLPNLNNIKSLPNPDATLNKYLVALQPTTIELLTDIETVEDGIKCCRQLLVSYRSSFLGLVAHSALPNLLHRAFKCTNEIEYLNEAISAARDHFNTGLPIHRILSHLILIDSLSARLELLYHREDLDELMQLFAMAAKHENVLLMRHSPISWAWVSMACRFRHPSAPTAYNNAISSMKTHLTTAPSLDVQYSRLVAIRSGFETVPLDYTSYQIYTGRLEQAVETLERGRALLWSEMRGLRTSMDQIRLADSRLADNFAAVNRDLETLTFDSSPNDNSELGHNDPEHIDRFGRLEAQKQKLLDDRHRLISQIQALPGFNNFLKPPSFDTLHLAACHGPVIVINHGEWRSDILILLHNSPPSLIPTSDDFRARAAKLQDQLHRERRKGLESDKFEDALRTVLKELYELIGRPVIKRLNELNVPEQSRVWWCPTSIFCSLPLHAMGPIPSDVGPPRYFLDVYIPSYTPSLSALIEAHKPGSQVTDKPSILLVAQPDENMPQALKEMKAVQGINTQVTTLFRKQATPDTVLARLRDHPFTHIVCHGILEPGKPLETSFKLHRGRRLRLLDIVRSQLPDAEFAFLSACHTAELTDEYMSDEVLHLTAAMQFCGFRSVVGTMWAMADIDGRDLARDFYESVFSETQGAPYYGRTAKALRDAVKNLRRKGGMTLERWVNFVHYGA